MGEGSIVVSVWRLRKAAYAKGGGRGRGEGDVQVGSKSFRVIMEAGRMQLAAMVLPV